MLAFGIVPLVFVVLMYALAALVLYWIIRLAVRHGTLDAYRTDRVDRRIAAMQADIGATRAPSSDPHAD